MALPSSPYRIERHGEIVLIRFPHNPVDRVVVEQMNHEIHAMLEDTDQPRFVVDFQGVTEITSAVLGVVMGINLKVTRRRGALRLCGIGPELGEIFQILKLDKILQIDDSLQTSLARIHAT